MLKTIAIVGTVAMSTSAFALSLSEYLAQVEGQSLRYKQSQAQAEGSRLVSREADLLTSPNFFLEARKSFDTSLGTPPMSMYDRYDNDVYRAGISQQFSFGLETKFSYAVTKNAYEGSTFNPDKYWDASPSVELTMPLWANGFGSGIKAQEELTRQQNKADEYANLALSQNLLIEAEVAYWQLSASQERVKIQEQALTAGNNILSYVQKQKQKNLGESADVLQANALVEAYKLQLQQAVNERLRLSRTFNKYLNANADAPVPSLDSLNYNYLETLKIPDQRPGDRLDVKASRAQAALAKASSDLILERNKPTLNLVGGYTLQGRGTETSKAFENSAKTNHDRGYVGVMFQLPLNFKAVADAKAGAQRLKDSADINEQNLLYTQEQDWIDLRQSLSESKETLKLSRTMESAQKSKLENERSRLRQGRTTTYQVLLFEQDYTQAQASRVQAATQIIALESQLKLYQGEK